MSKLSGARALGPLKRCRIRRFRPGRGKRRGRRNPLWPWARERLGLETYPMQSVLVPFRVFRVFRGYQVIRHGGGMKIMARIQHPSPRLQLVSG